ncbi:hypothetical protein QBC44DRAFT_394154 [Cladorrhinum sp. PSN332]|nr:hypothetical protein QBC44DRAFT_394154 [Cladorrhinum sp. PSN332]
MARKRLVLKVLHEPTRANSRSNTPAVDVVLVHGLDGDPIKTWTEPVSGVLWPRELLPKKFANARVLSFGYNGDMYLNRSKAGIRTNAESLLAQLKARRVDDPNRPIVFVAHCLGGLIVKQLLSFAAHDDEKHGIIGTSTRGILFFGTPNNAVAKEQWELLAKAYAPLERKGSQLAGLVLALTRDAKDLAEVNEDFVHISDRYPIFSFYETEMWQGTEACIVNEQAARMFIDNEEGLPVGDDHVGMCRIDDRDDATFVDICRCIEQALAGGLETSNVPEDSESEEWVAADNSHLPQIDDAEIEALIRAAKSKAPRPQNLESQTPISPQTPHSNGHESQEAPTSALEELLIHDSKSRAKERVPVSVEYFATGTTTSTGWKRVPVTEKEQRELFGLFGSDSTRKKTARGKKFLSSFGVKFG